MENASGKECGVRNLHKIRKWMLGIMSQCSISYLSKGRKVNLMHLELHPDKICKCPDLYFVSPVFSIFKHDLRIKNCPLFHLQVCTYFSIFVVPENHLSSILQQRTSVFFWGGKKKISQNMDTFLN